MYLQVKDVKKSYGKDTSYIQVLKGVSTGLERGQMCVIQGTSGSGKSTLLNCIGGLDTMDSGSIKVDGTEIFGMKPAQLSDYRRDNLGFIFQFYNLVPNLTVRENIQICQYIAANIEKGETREFTRYFITSLTDLDEFADSVRKHWAIENNLHWCLDVIFKEDASRAKKDNSPLVLNIMRKIALNLVSQAQYKRISKRRLMFRAALEPTLFLDILFDPSSVSPQK